MSERFRNRLPEPEGRQSPDPEVVEVPLLLPGWQVSALERAAYHRGLTAGEMVRSVLQDFITRLPASGPGEVA